MSLKQQIFQGICNVAFLVAVLHFIIVFGIHALIVRAIQKVQKLLFPKQKLVEGFNFELFHFFFRLAFYVNDTHLHSIFPKDMDVDKEPTLILINHTSASDHAMVMCTIRTDVIFMAKASLFKNPIMKFYLDSGKTISVEREDREQAMGAVQQAENFLKSGTHVSIFPEGTRANQAHLEGGKLGPLKMGAFHCAKNANVRIMLLYCDGISRTWNSRLKLPIAGTNFIKFLGYVSKEEVAKYDVHELQKKVTEMYDQGRQCRSDDEIFKFPNPNIAILFLLANLWVLKFFLAKLF